MITFLVTVATALSVFFCAFLALAFLCLMATGAKDKLILIWKDIYGSDPGRHSTRVHMQLCKQHVNEFLVNLAYMFMNAVFSAITLTLSWVQIKLLWPYGLDALQFIFGIRVVFLV